MSLSEERVIRLSEERTIHLGNDDALRAYRIMKTIREFEERLHLEFQTGEIPGFVHLYAGQEAIATGVCSHLGSGGPHCQYPSRARTLHRQGL